MKCKTRNTAIDIMKGIAIISVVLGHCWLLSSSVIHFIYSFHMPLFFIVAGYFYRDKNITVQIKADFVRLIFPYILFASIVVLKFSVSGILNNDYMEFPKQLLRAFYATSGPHKSFYLSQIPGIGVIWFLPAMFVCKSVYNASNKLRLGSIIITIIAIVATLLDVYIINLPLGILVGCSAMIFYHIGDQTRKFHINKGLFIFGIICWGISLKYSAISVGSCRYGLYPVDIIGASAGTYVIYLLSKKIQHIFKWIAKGLAFMGKNSMIVLCMHYVEQIIDINSRLGTQQWYLYLMYEFMLIIPFTYFCTKNKYTRLLFQVKI